MKETIAGIILVLVVIGISLFLGRDIEPNINNTKECENLIGLEREYCIQNIEQQRSAQDDYYQSKEIRNLP